MNKNKVRTIFDDLSFRIKSLPLAKTFVALETHSTFILLQIHLATL